MRGRLLERMGRSSSGEEAAVRGTQVLRAVDLLCWPACSNVFQVQRDGPPGRRESGARGVGPACG